MPAKTTDAGGEASPERSQRESSSLEEIEEIDETFEIEEIEEIDRIDEIDEDEAVAGGSLEIPAEEKGLGDAPAPEAALLEAGIPVDGAEPSRFSFRQKAAILFTVLASFLLFSALLFPLESAVNYFLADYFDQSELSYANSDLSLFGSSRVDGLQIAAGGLLLKARDLETDISLWQFLGNSVVGTVYLTDLALTFQEIDILAEVIRIDLDLREVDMPFNRWAGRAEISAAGLRSFQLPFEALQVIDLDKLQLASVKLRQVFRNGAIRLDGSTAASNLFNMTLSGKAELSRGLDAIQLNSQLCLQPAGDLEEREPDIWSIYLLASGGEAQEQLCFDLKGPLSSPAIKKAPAETVDQSSL